MAVANRPSLRWGALSLIAATILCHLTLSAASSDLPNLEVSEEASAGTSGPQAGGSVQGTPGETTAPSHAAAELSSQSATQTELQTSGHSGASSSAAEDGNGEPLEASSRPRGRSCPRERRRTLPWRTLPQTRTSPRHRPRSGVFRKVLTLLVVLFFTALTGAIVLNCTSFGEMMAHDGAYAELCTQNNTTSNSTTGIQSTVTTARVNSSITNNGTSSTAGQPYRCHEQREHVQGIYSVVFAAACVSSALAGPLIDYAGPRLSSFFGHLVGILGLVLFALQHYVPGLALVSAGEQVAFLASLSASQLFPTSASLIVGLLGALASLSTVVPTILNLIVSTNTAPAATVIWTYAAVVCVPALIAEFVLLPGRQPTHFAAPEAELTPLPPESSEVTTQDEVLSDSSLTREPRAGRLPLELGRFGRLLHLLLRAIVRVLGDLRRNTVLRRNLFSVGSFLVMLNFAASSITNAYFIQGLQGIFVGPAREGLPIATPVSAIPCIFLGWVADSCGACTASVILVISGMIMIIASFFGNDAAGYVGLASLTVYMSAITSQVLWTARELFPEACRNTVAGLILSLGGVLSLLSNVLPPTSATGGFTVRLGLGFWQLVQLFFIYVIYRQIRMRNGYEDAFVRAVRRLFRRGRYSLTEHPRIRELPE